MSDVKPPLDPWRFADADEDSDEEQASLTDDEVPRALSPPTRPLEEEAGASPPPTVGLLLYARLARLRWLFSESAQESVNPGIKNKYQFVDGLASTLSRLNAQKIREHLRAYHADNIITDEYLTALAKVTLNPSMLRKNRNFDTGYSVLFDCALWALCYEQPTDNTTSTKQLIDTLTAGLLNTANKQPLVYSKDDAAPFFAAVGQEIFSDFNQSLQQTHAAPLSYLISELFDTEKDTDALEQSIERLLTRLDNIKENPFSEQDINDAWAQICNELKGIANEKAKIFSKADDFIMEDKCYFLVGLFYEYGIFFTKDFIKAERQYTKSNLFAAKYQLAEQLRRNNEYAAAWKVLKRAIPQKIQPKDDAIIYPRATYRVLDDKRFHGFFDASKKSLLLSRAKKKYFAKIHVLAAGMASAPKEKKLELIEAVKKGDVPSIFALEKLCWDKNNRDSKLAVICMMCLLENYANPILKNHRYEINTLLNKNLTQSIHYRQLFFKMAFGISKELFITYLLDAVVYNRMSTDDKKRVIDYKLQDERLPDDANNPFRDPTFDREAARKYLETLIDDVTRDTDVHTVINNLTAPPSELVAQPVVVLPEKKSAKNKQNTPVSSRTPKKPTAKPVVLLLPATTSTMTEAPAESEIEPQDDATSFNSDEETSPVASSASASSVSSAVATKPLAPVVSKVTTPVATTSQYRANGKSAATIAPSPKQHQSRKPDAPKAKINKQEQRPGKQETHRSSPAVPRIQEAAKAAATASAPSAKSVTKTVLYSTVAKNLVAPVQIQEPISPVTFSPSVQIGANEQGLPPISFIADEVKILAPLPPQEAVVRGRPDEDFSGNASAVIHQLFTWGSLRFGK